MDPAARTLPSSYTVPDITAPWLTEVPSAVVRMVLAALSLRGIFIGRFPENFVAAFGMNVW